MSTFRCAVLVCSLCVLPIFGQEPPSRADRLKAIQDEYAKASEEFGKDIRAGKIKPNEQGEYPGWTDLLKRFAKPTCELIDADPADAVALDALVFSLNDLGAGEFDPDLYKLVLKHHVKSEKIDPLIRSESAPVDFLRVVVAESPHETIRLWASYHLAENLHAAGKTEEAERILEALKSNEDAKKHGFYGFQPVPGFGRSNTLADGAERLLFEIRRLGVGKEVPEIDGVDLDGKPMRLSDSRGKVTLLVFWATWCGPCMAMVPHERALVKRYASSPFAIMGVNGNNLPPGPEFKVKRIDPFGNEIEIDPNQEVQEAINKHKITWRSFRNGYYTKALGYYTISNGWNVRSWPTIYLIDHEGIIRGKWKGDPGKKVLDEEIERLVKIAEEAKK